MSARILVVDDIESNVRLLQAKLEAEYYEVLTASDGPTALAIAASERPDIVLLDAVMPGMDGFEVARRLKAQPDTAHIPIIFMTGLTETEHVVAAFAAGGVDYVTKPIRPQEVLARMSVHMQSARQARQARNALDAFGHATMAVHVTDNLRAGRAVWQTPLARQLMHTYFAVAPGQVAHVEGLVLQAVALLQEDEGHGRQVLGPARPPPRQAMALGRGQQERLDVELPAETDFSRARRRIIGMVDGVELLELAFGIVLDHDLERPQHRHAPQ